MRRRVAAISIAALIAVTVAIPTTAHAGSMTLNQLAAQLSVASPTSRVFDPASFGSWTSTTNDGCDTRDNLLKAQSYIPVTYNSGCNIDQGWWVSPYDRQQWTEPYQVEIDHVVPLGEAWSSGAWAWTDAQRSVFFNDAGGDELQIVTAALVQQKGDTDPSGWMPVANQAKCPYITHWILSKYRWSLTIDADEKSAIAGYLSNDGCGDQVIEVPERQIGTTSTGIDSTLALPVYRFWSPQNKSHFFTASAAERDQIIANYPPSVWTYEGYRYNAFATQQPGTVPLYRFWSGRLGGHFYTTSASERDSIIASYDTFTWHYEGVAYYVYPNDATASDTVPVARFWSPTNQHHFYTASADEAATVKTYPAAIWSYEGDAFRAPSPAPAIKVSAFQITCSGTYGVPTVTVSNPNSFAFSLSTGYDTNGDNAADSGESTTLIPAGIQGFQWSTIELPQASTGTVIMTFGATIVYTKSFAVSCPNPPAA